MSRHGWLIVYRLSGREAPSRKLTCVGDSAEAHQSAAEPSPPENFIVMMNASAYITQQIASIAYVTGEVCGIQRLSDLLAAAKENVMFAPHWWHLVAVAPTSVPQAGQSRGRSLFRLGVEHSRQSGCASGRICSAIEREVARRLLARKFLHAYNSRNRARTRNSKYSHRGHCVSIEVPEGRHIVAHRRSGGNADTVTVSPDRGDTCG